MPFLPSLLEYTPQALEAKLQLIINNPTEFQAIQKSPDDKIYLHLDFVLPEFAASRNVEPGNSLEIVFDLILKHFEDQKVVCNCHFMGSTIDTAKVQEFFKTYTWNPNWKYILYVGQEFVEKFGSKFGSIPQINQIIDQKIKIGAWLDLDQNNLDSQFGLNDYLLMTVFAGKSGQKLTEEVRQNTIKVIQKNSNVNFTIDGGWVVTDGLNELNSQQKNKLSVVSYSSFWKELDKLLAK